MARGSIYRTDVENARKELLAQGKTPTVDAIRLIIGRGSNTTILRYLQDINTEASRDDRPKAAISDALAETVQRLAEQLHAEADERIAQIRSDCDAQVAEYRMRGDQAVQERLTFATQYQRTEVALQAEQTTHAECQRALTEASMLNRQLEERVAGLSARVTEHEAHAQSLEEKHRHAREALEHYRTSVKEQRDQEQRRHEHQVQELQVELRKANEGMTTKNHELLQLNRDNVRLTEQVTQQDRELHQVRGDLRQRDQDLAAVKGLPAELRALKAEWTSAVQANETLRAQLATAGNDLAKERDARMAADKAAAGDAARLRAFEEVIEALKKNGASIADANSLAAAKQASQI
jgi:chromosome segregation ATPase